MENSQQDMLGESEPYITAKFPHRTIPYTFPLGNGETYDGFVNRKLENNMKYRIFIRAFVDTPQKVINKTIIIIIIFFFKPNIKFYCFL